MDNSPRTTLVAIMIDFHTHPVRVQELLERDPGLAG